MKKYHFSGYATKAGVKCSDGRVIHSDAFKEQDGFKVPLVWQHMHGEPTNVLGHAMLENRKDGVYAYCNLNDSETGKHAKELIKHGDITEMSIFANNLVQKGKDVIHGAIREVSLVLTGANPEARIDNIAFCHSDDSDPIIDETEAIVYSGETIIHEDDDDDFMAHSDDEKTVQDVFDTLNEEQKTVFMAVIAHAISDGADDEDDEDDDDNNSVKHSKKGGKEMKKNVFDKTQKDPTPTLSHDQLRGIIEDAQKCGSFKEAFLSHAATYGIENIEILFPDAKTVTPTPEIVGRDQSWVQGIISGSKHSPFSRIKSTYADLTADEARAKGYIKGNKKVEEVFPVMKRVTTPTTIYKKQKLDRDDIIDITDLNVVAWIKSEMRIMLNEEIARAMIIGDGRAVDNPDKVNELNIRPIWKDDDLYTIKKTLPATAKPEDLMEAILRVRKQYKGSGNPTLYTTEDTVTDLLLQKDTTGRRIYPTMAELTSALRVSNIVTVEVMEGQTRNDGTNDLELIGLMFNISDYTVGADKGGEIAMFDDFDIDYNQYKYLLETRISGALTKPYTAVAIEKIKGAGAAG